MALESGFVKAASDNLPKVDNEMVETFFLHNLQFLSAEVRNVKTKRYVLLNKIKLCINKGRNICKVHIYAFLA